MIQLKTKRHDNFHDTWDDLRTVRCLRHALS